MKDNIRLIASELEDGESMYMDCPSCGRPKKFSITMDGGRAVYHCFRPSCDLYAGGTVSSDGSRLVRTRSTPREQKIRPYEGEITHLTDEWLEYLHKEIGWERMHLEIGRPMYAVEEHRVAYPLFSPLGRRRGWSLRSYNGAEPKALTRPDSEEPHTSWYWHDITIPEVVVVEDIPSAVRVARYRNSVALNGTGCGPDYAQELAAHSRHVVWALDNDASAQAVSLHRKYNLMFESSRVLLLDKDFKNMTEKEIQACLRNL